MEQGKIADILSSRPEDRRSIFEEAAGITKYKSQRKEALRKLEATENPLCRFHRASVLFSAGRLKEALEELEELKDLVPKESLVYYLLGKVHNKLGNSHLALMHFSWATDLDPKGASGHIKEAFDPARSEDLPDPILSVT